jgi:hypothetical protein
MSVNYVKVDTFQTRFSQSFVNLTQLNPTTFPATTSVNIEYRDSDTTTPSLTNYFIFDQWALRTTALPFLSA